MVIKMNEKYMKIALTEAKKALKNGDVPVGAIIVKENKIIARGYNKKEKNKDSTNHAEIIAIRKACKKLNSWRLDDCIMYVTLEPCLMCAGAILQARMKKLIYAVNNEKFGFVGSIDNIINNDKNNHFVEIEKDILREESLRLLKNFFKDKRK